MRAAYWIVLIFTLSILWRLYDGPQSDIIISSSGERLIVRMSRKRLAHFAACALACAVGFSAFEVGYAVLIWNNGLNVTAEWTELDRILLIVSLTLAGPFVAVIVVGSPVFVYYWFTWFAFDRKRQTFEKRGEVLAPLSSIECIEIRELPADPDEAWDGEVSEWYYSVRVLLSPAGRSLSNTLEAPVPVANHFELHEARYLANAVAEHVRVAVRVTAAAHRETALSRVPKARSKPR